MQAALSASAARLAVVLALAAGGCDSAHAWPYWAEKLEGQLRCGMTLVEVQRIVSGPVTALESGPHPRLGGYYVEKGHSTLWMRFDQSGRLQEVTLSSVDGWRFIATRLTPRRNLCTGTLTFFLRILVTRDFDDARFFLDGKEVQLGDGVLEVSPGFHVLRIEKGGSVPIVRHLMFRSTDRGDQRLDLTHERFRPE